MYVVWAPFTRLRRKPGRPVLELVVGHAREHVPWHIELPCTDQNGPSPCGCDRIADDRHQPDQRVCPDPQVGSWHMKRVVEHVSDLLSLLLFCANQDHR